ncbi:hypothetical protein JAAARDRAFT_550621 [Jaapia argillacea MUCL 33604]|uniref:Uncharacterized protein n=1 Tax=Jaapia argillacea MUCL 33604 TaxID=933084 RepID=A0A067PI79_9AGAM|nr:hypothetical protein JAAARDRAFT_550621 [Jaapia argillacea MUCL 33604]
MVLLGCWDVGWERRGVRRRVLGGMTRFIYLLVSGSLQRLLRTSTELPSWNRQRRNLSLLMMVVILAPGGRWALHTGKPILTSLIGRLRYIWLSKHPEVSLPALLKLLKALESTSASSSSTSDSHSNAEPTDSSRDAPYPYPSLQPTLVTYAVVIDGLLKKGEWESGLFV